MNALGDAIGTFVLLALAAGMLRYAARWPRDSWGRWLAFAGAFAGIVLAAPVESPSLPVRVSALVFMGVFAGSLIGGIIDHVRGRLSSSQ